MSLLLSHCLQGEYCVVTENKEASHRLDSKVKVKTPDRALQIKTSDIGTKMANPLWTTRPSDMYDNNPPSEFELNRKARSLGLLFNREKSGLTLVSKGHPVEEYGDKQLRHSLPGIRELTNNGDLTSGQRGNRFPNSKTIMLPKIPNIKHPFERRVPHLMQREKSSCELPMSLTSMLTPRSKTTLDPPSFVSKKSKTGVAGEGWSSRDDPGQHLGSSTSHLVIAPKSKANFHRSSGDYYYRKFPHVIMDQDSGVIHSNGDRNRLIGSKNMINKTGVSDTIRTTNELFNLTRSKTDMMAVEQLIARSANRLKTTSSAVSGWLDGMTCNPKKLHQRKYTFV